MDPIESMEPMEPFKPKVVSALLEMKLKYDEYFAELVFVFLIEIANFKRS